MKAGFRTVKPNFTTKGRFLFMKKEIQKKRLLSVILSAVLLTAFVLWTVTLYLVDVQPIGPNGSAVGLATLNASFHALTGVHMTLYTLTDWLGLIPLAAVSGFAILGLAQWIKRKRLRRVDASILILGGFYVAVLALYVLFEAIAVNYRPILIEGVLEASYPSSTTLLTLCIMPTAALQLHTRIHGPIIRRLIIASILLFTLFTVTARLLSGVHWLTDIIGGILISASLVLAYAVATST